MTKNIPERPHVRAQIAAAYLYADDANPLVWRGLKERGVDYEAILDRTGPLEILDRTGPLVLRIVSFDLLYGVFRIDPLGEQAYLHMVHSEVDSKEIVDVVAWSASQPYRYGTFFGHSGLLGGDAVLNPECFVECPCPIWATPLAWLRSSLRGCVVLNPQLAAPILAGAPGKFQAENDAHARWLIRSGAVVRDQLQRPKPQTRISVPHRLRAIDVNDPLAGASTEIPGDAR
jgi:hypothetical protein